MQKVKEDKVAELKIWKERVDEVVSPTQIKTLVEEVESLKAFKTKAVTAFVVVQFLMGFVVWLSKFLASGG